jgi:tol-pal system protein YbgF
VKDLYGNLDKRVAAFEPQTERVDGRRVTVSPEEKRIFENALELFSSGKYAQSRRMFDKLLADYPQTEYRPTAFYWLGNVHFAQGNLAQAVSYQTRLIREYPGDARVPDAMLSLSSALASQGKQDQALKTLRQIRSRFPDSEAAQLAAERIKALK